MDKKKYIYVGSWNKAMDGLTLIHLTVRLMYSLATKTVHLKISPLQFQRSFV